MDVFEEYYNTFYKKIAEIDAKGNTFSKIENFLPELPENAKVLDIGCGFGSVSHELVKRGFDVYGIEINEDAKAELRVKGIKVLENDISKPFAMIVERFDLILLLDILEHIFDPLFLMKEACSVLNNNGEMIISVPLYFDLIDRFRILFTGSIISYDNISYGKELYNKFRSYNYDHIRFYRPKDIFEMCTVLGLKIQKYQYSPFWGIGVITRVLRKILVNKYTLNVAPGLFAHGMMVRVKK
jgi:2-polyprenyl-3-methyl-5-hydroxy-6-metoxy-1,4-benzoquinol methylase